MNKWHAFFILELALVTLILGFFIKFIVARPTIITAVFFIGIILLFIILYEILKKYQNSLVLESVLVALALVFAFLLFYVPPDSIADLEVNPDSIEYAISAYNLYKNGDYKIYLNKEGYYPRYSFGYPISIIPFYIMFGAELQNAVYASLFFALGSVFLVYLIARKVFNKFTAIIAMILISISPIMIEYSRLVMSETISIFFILLVTLLIITLNKKYLFYIGLLAGFLVTIRFPNIMTILGFIVLIFLQAKHEKLKSIILFCIGVFISLIPLFYYNLVRFGNILRTGYNYWLPELHDTGLVFSGNYISQNLYGYSINLLGLNFIAGPYGLYYQLAIALFIGIGIYKVAENIEYKRFLLFTLITTLLFLSFYSFFMFLHPRLMFLTVPLIVLFGAYGIASTLRFKSYGWISVFLVLVILLNTISITYETFRKEPRVSWRLPLDQRNFKTVIAANSYLEDNAQLVSMLNGAYVTHYFVNGDRIYIPLSQKAEYMYTGFVCPRKNNCKNLNLFAATENTDKITYILKKEMPIYVDDYSCSLNREACIELSKNFIFEKKSYNGLIFYRIHLEAT